MSRKDSTNLLLYAIISVAILRSAICHAETFGPRENPENYADYGGTPDLVLSGDVGFDAEELSILLDRLSAPDLKQRIDAAATIKKNAAGCESVFRKALWQVGFVRHTELKDVLKRAAASAGQGKTGALMSELIQMDPSVPAVSLTTRVVVMLVALHSLDTMAGYKVLLDFSGRHAGAFRGLIGEMMVHAGLKALPALIYGRGSRNEELHMFSVAWIREMGDPLLSEQIQGIRNSRRLAQLLEAYASVNELDAIDVTLSCANHESSFVRNSARAALALYGNNAKWSIHREYENNFEDEPADGTDYEDWAAALYELWDKQREAKTQSIFQKGLDAAEAGDYKAMDTHFRSLLSTMPLFVHRSQMASGYLKYAESLAEAGHHEQAMKTNRMAKRLAEEGSADYRLATARLEWLQAEKNRIGGGLDVDAFKQLAAQPGMADRASEWAEYGIDDSATATTPWGKIIAVSLVIFFGALLIFIRIRLLN